MPHKNLMAKIIALEILESGIKIPSLPASAQRLMSIAQQPQDKIDIKELEQLIQRDPVLFAQMVNLANSSYYGTGKESVGLRNAIMRIGLDETISFLYLYLFKNALPVFPKIKGISDKEYWEESWACAVANRRLGDPRLLVDVLPGDLYIAGLLQGIGKLILAVYNPKLFYECVKINRSSGRSLEQAELDTFGTTDALIAHNILESWHIPTNICAAVGYCNNPESAEPEYREIAALTQFARAIVKIAGAMDSGEGDDSLSAVPDLTDLANTYISKHSTSLLANSVEQQKVVQEILSTLERQSPVTQTPTFKKPTEKRDFEKSNTGVSKNLSSGPGEKKGLFSWIRALFMK